MVVQHHRQLLVCYPRHRRRGGEGTAIAACTVIDGELPNVAALSAGEQLSSVETE